MAHVKLSDYKGAAATEDTVRAFLSSETLQEPLIVAKTDAFTSYYCCCAWSTCLASMGSTCFCPIALFCPGQVTTHFDLKVTLWSMH